MPAPGRSGAPELISKLDRDFFERRERSRFKPEQLLPQEIFFLRRGEGERPAGARFAAWLHDRLARFGQFHQPGTSQHARGCIAPGEAARVASADSKEA